MSYGLEAARKKVRPTSAANAGASPECVAATLLFCTVGGALFVATVVVGAIGFASYAMSESEEERLGRAGRRIDALQARVERDRERLRERTEAVRPAPQRSGLLATPADSGPRRAALSPAFLRHEASHRSRFARASFERPGFESPNFESIQLEHRFSPSALERPAPGRMFLGPDHRTGASTASFPGKAPVSSIVRPASLTYSRATSRSPVRTVAGGETEGSTTRAVDERLERLRSLSQDPAAFAEEAFWFAERRPSLSGATAASVEQTIAEFILSENTEKAVEALPRVLTWYDGSNLKALAETIERAVERESPRSSTSQRQILVGCFQRYRLQDPDWRDPATGDVLQALTKSITLASHIAPSIDELHSPFPGPVEDFLIEFSFAPASESMYAQRKALMDPSARDRLLERAIENLESPDEAKRESAYVLLAAAGSTPDRADVVLDAIRHAFAEEDIDPSPAAHAALVCWIDDEHAADFREFCDCECPVRRFAARAAVSHYFDEREVLASAVTE